MLFHYWNIGTFKLLHADWLSDWSVATLTSLHDWSVATFPSLHNWSVAMFLSLHKAQLECCHIPVTPQLECCHIPITPQLECCHIPITPLVLQHSFHSTTGVWPHSWWRLLHNWSVAIFLVEITPQLECGHIPDGDYSTTRVWHIQTWMDGDLCSRTGCEPVWPDGYMVSRLMLVRVHFSSAFSIKKCGVWTLSEIVSLIVTLQ